MAKPESCGLGPAFQVIGGKWKALLLWRVHQEPRRFGELKRLIPEISEKMLIQTLREMEADGLVHREVEYSATRLGASLDEALVPLANWGTKYAKRLEATQER